MSDPTVVKLVGVMISYPKLFKPEPIQDNPEPKFSCRYILPKNFDNTAIKAAMKAAAHAKFQGDGTEKNTISKTKADEPVPGHFVLNTTNYVESPAQVLDSKLQPIMDPNEIFAGCIVDAVVKFTGYTTGSKGIRCESKIIVLRNNKVARLNEGGGDLAAEDFFEPVEGAPNQTAASTADVQQQQQQDTSFGQPAGNGVQTGAPAEEASDDPWNDDMIGF